MSYILDALKKAEADRDPEARASLAMAQHQQRRNRWLSYGLVIALIANAVILLWLFLPTQPQLPTSSSEPESAAREQAAPERTPSPRSQTIAESEPAQTPASQPAQQPPERPARTPESASAVTPPARTAEVIQPPAMAAETATGETIIRPGTVPVPTAEPTPVNSLPSAQRARFPELTFSTHIYADDADLRAIVVNGTRLEEGDRLGNLSLSEITEDGAVFRFEDRLVLVSVLDGWD